MKNIKSLSLCIMAAFTVALASCKVEDPFLNRDVAPVLVDIVGAAFGAPIASTPTVSYDSSKAELILSSRLLELDKTNILDYSKGIDSIPVPNLNIKVGYSLSKNVKTDTVKFKGNTYIFKAESFSTSGDLGTITSDASGTVTVKTTYAALGLSGNRIQRKDDIIKLTWTGIHKGIAFTRTSQMSVTKN